MRRSIFLVISLVLGLLMPSTVRAAPAPAQGTLVIIGGALRDDNHTVWQRIVALAGGQGARIAVLATASSHPQEIGDELVARLQASGAQAFVVPVAQGLPGRDVRQAADDMLLARQVAECGGVYFAGGDQARITRALRRPDGSSTRVLEAVWQVYRQGGVIAGSSAGAAIMSRTMFGKPPPVLATLKNGVTQGLHIQDGLGFIGDDVFIDQHLLVRGRFARMLPAMLAAGYQLGLGVDENTALVVGPSRQVEVIGYRGALLIDLSQASTREGPFNISNVRLSYLDNGDRLDLHTGRLTPAPDKAGGRIDSAAPSYHGALFSADILGHTAVVTLMEKLIDSDQEQAIGLSFGSPQTEAPELGFEFRFSRTSQSVGYRSRLGDAVSVYQVRLDVRPIQMFWPLYHYR